MQAATPPLVSILLPFYKEQNSLHAAVKSVLQQSIDQWELLLINNNADVASQGIACSYAGQDVRIKLLKETRQGIAHALNKGLAHSRAPFIARLDADDEMLPQRLEKQAAFLREHPEIGVVACRCLFKSTLDKAAGYRYFVEWQNRILSPEDHYLNRFVESPVAHPSVMFRRQLVANWGAYSTQPIPEDYELWLRWMSKGVPFAKLPEELVLWNDHPHRLSRTNAHYSNSAFMDIKMEYLAQWLQAKISSGRKIIICGASPEIRAKARRLEAKGIPVWGYTDVKNRQAGDLRFIPIHQLQDDGDYFFLNLIEKRGVGQQIRTLLSGMGFTEEEDFMLAG